MCTFLGKEPENLCESGTHGVDPQLVNVVFANPKPSEFVLKTQP